jgi:short-subunit dehydrogenase
MELQNKVIWITGASSGIGAALVELLHQDNQLILSARGVEKMKRLLDNINADKDKHFILPLDLSNHQEMQGKCDEVIMKFGQIDCMVHNGGISQRAFSYDASFEVDKKVIDIDLLGTIALTKVVLPEMLKKSSGQFVVISSLAGKFGVKLRSAYCAAKHGLHGYFDSLRAECHEKGIGVTLICPGFINTDVSKNALTGTGAQSGRHDESQANGMSAAQCAKKIISAVNKGKEEQLIGGKEIIAVYLKRFLPRVLSKVLRNAKV